MLVSVEGIETTPLSVCKQRAERLEAELEGLLAHVGCRANGAPSQHAYMECTNAQIVGPNERHGAIVFGGPLSLSAGSKYHAVSTSVHNVEPVKISL